MTAETRVALLALWMVVMMVAQTVGLMVVVRVAGTVGMKVELKAGCWVALMVAY